MVIFADQNSKCEWSSVLISGPIHCFSQPLLEAIEAALVLLTDWWHLNLWRGVIFQEIKGGTIQNQHISNRHQQNNMNSINSTYMASHIEKLPNELLIMIIKMVIKDKGRPHDLLLGTIAKISTRFQRLARDRMLWRGQVNIIKVEEVIDFLNDGVRNVFMDCGTSVTRNEIRSLAERCTKLKMLNYPTISSWPALDTPWYSLKYIAITLEGNGAFDQVELHRSLPNLVYLHIRVSGTHRVTLPDMRGCSKLKILILGHGNEFLAPEGIIPFPTGLRMLASDMYKDAIIHLVSVNDTVMGCLKHCKIRYVNFSS